MNDRRRPRRGNLNSRILMLMILIGFCILAIIEIIFGQARIRVEKQRLALEEENKQSMQKLESEWSDLKELTNVTVDEIKSDTSVSKGKESALVPDKTVENVSASGNTDTVSQNTLQNSPEEESVYDMQIVFLGDSILDNDREDDGVAKLVGEQCNARVFNMAMGGTTAAMLPGESREFSKWESRSLLGVVNAILGNIDPAIFDGYHAGEVLKECDFSKTDYFVVEYGVNDFLTGRIPQSVYLDNGDTLAVDQVCTYSGALFTAVRLLQDNFPNAKILLIAPHYCQIYSGDTFMGDGYSIDYGYGTLVDFSRCTGYVYDQNKDKNVLFFNAFELSGIDAYTADKYLEDGVHLSAEGRRVYAGCIARILNGDFRPEE